ncbi:MAG: hypothetical protein QFF03_21880 [Pseudomonadota bacterium]|nr:hypothetical protein [Pseudomonadota bacterium]
MKSVSLSRVVRAHDSYRFFCPIQSWSQLLSLALTLGLGLPLIAMLLMLLDPTAPLGYIVVPVAVGGVVPMFVALPARFEVMTRFHAQHFAGTLDRTLVSMGYVLCAEGPQQQRCYRRQANWLRWKENDIAVSVREHAIAVSGPVFALRALQQKLG